MEDSTERLKHPNQTALHGLRHVVLKTVVLQSPSLQRDLVETVAQWVAGQTARLQRVVHAATSDSHGATHSEMNEALHCAEAGDAFLALCAGGTGKANVHRILTACRTVISETARALPDGRGAEAKVLTARDRVCDALSNRYHAVSMHDGPISRALEACATRWSHHRSAAMNQLKASLLADAPQKTQCRSVVSLVLRRGGASSEPSSEPSSILQFVLRDFIQSALQRMSHRLSTLLPLVWLQIHGFRIEAQGLVSLTAAAGGTSQLELGVPSVPPRCETCRQKRGPEGHNPADACLHVWQLAQEVACASGSRAAISQTTCGCNTDHIAAGAASDEACPAMGLLCATDGSETAIDRTAQRLLQSGNVAGWDTLVQACGLFASFAEASRVAGVEQATVSALVLKPVHSLRQTTQAASERAVPPACTASQRVHISLSGSTGVDEVASSMQRASPSTDMSPIITAAWTASFGHVANTLVKDLCSEWWLQTAVRTASQAAPSEWAGNDPSWQLQSVYEPEAPEGGVGADMDWMPLAPSMGLSCLLQMLGTTPVMWSGGDSVMAAGGATTSAVWSQWGLPAAGRASEAPMDSKQSEGAYPLLKQRMYAEVVSIYSRLVAGATVTDPEAGWDPSSAEAADSMAIDQIVLSPTLLYQLALDIQVIMKVTRMIPVVVEPEVLRNIEAAWTAVGDLADPVEWTLVEPLLERLSQQAFDAAAVLLQPNAHSPRQLEASVPATAVFADVPSRLTGIAAVSRDAFRKRKQKQTAPPAASEPRLDSPSAGRKGMFNTRSLLSSATSLWKSP